MPPTSTVISGAVKLQAEAAAIGGVEVLFFDGEDAVPKQSEDVLAAVTQQVDGLLISPKDSVAMAPAIQEAVDADVPVMTIDRRVDGVEILGHVGADNVKGGEAQGMLVMERFPDGATIVNLQGQPGSSPAIDRNAGVHNVLDDMSDKYVFVAEQTANFSRTEAVTVLEGILAGLDAPPDVIVAANDDATHDDATRGGNVFEPQQPARVRGQGYHPVLVAGNDQVGSDNNHLRANVGKTVQLGAAFHGHNALIPDHAAVGHAQTRNTAVVVPDESNAGTYQQVGVAAQGQQRNAVVVNPDAATIILVEAENTAVDATHHDNAVGRCRRRQHFR